MPTTTITVSDWSFDLIDPEILFGEFGGDRVRVRVAGPIKGLDHLIQNPRWADGLTLETPSMEGSLQVTLSVSAIYQPILADGTLLVDIIIQQTVGAGREADRYEFVLPNVDYGISDLMTTDPLDWKDGTQLRTQFEDRCEFIVEGIVWTLRKLYAVGDKLIPGDIMVSRNLKGERTTHAMLHVPANSICLESAEQTADDIGWLLELALAQRVSWFQSQSRLGTASTLLRRRGVPLASEPNKNSPLRNLRDGKIKTFIESAFPIFRRDPQWWRVTLNWYAIAHENAVIEVSGAIFSILLDRVSGFLLRGAVFEKQIDKSLDENLGGKNSDKWKTACAAITETVRRFCPAWTEDRSASLLREIRRWNDTPSYANKIRTALKDLPVQEPDRRFTDPRHVLLHEGELRVDGISTRDYYLGINELITTLLLATLEYRGSFYLLGVGEKRL